ncbi:MAG TPA: hypothetical protein VIM93_07390 [Kangiella sp.]
MKKSIYLLLAIAIFTLIIIFVRGNSFQGKNVKGQKDSSSSVKVSDSRVTERHLIKDTIDSNDEKLSFDELRHFWESEFPLSDIELTLLSRVSAKSFIEQYQYLADNGDKLVSFYIAYLKDVCARTLLEDTKLNQGNTNRNPKYLLLSNTVGQCQGVFDGQPTHEEVQKLSNQKFDSHLSFMLDQEVSFNDFSKSDLSNIPPERSSLYEDIEGDRGAELNVAFYEGMARIDSSASLNTVVDILSSHSMTLNKNERQELAAWLVTSCASGYPCDYSQYVANNLIQFCQHASLDCEGKPLEAIVEEYAPDSSYEDILSRSMEISEYIANGEGTTLLKSYLKATKE